MGNLNVGGGSEDVDAFGRYLRDTGARNLVDLVESEAGDLSHEIQAVLHNPTLELREALTLDIESASFQKLLTFLCEHSVVKEAYYLESDQVFLNETRKQRKSEVLSAIRAGQFVDLSGAIPNSFLDMANYLKDISVQYTKWGMFFQHAAGQDPQLMEATLTALRVALRKYQSILLEFYKRLQEFQTRLIDAKGWVMTNYFNAVSNHIASIKVTEQVIQALLNKPIEKPEVTLFGESDDSNPLLDDLFMPPQR